MKHTPHPNYRTLPAANNRDAWLGLAIVVVFLGTLGAGVIFIGIQIVQVFS